jgi:hypothetical protein
MTVVSDIVVNGRDVIPVLEKFQSRIPELKKNGSEIGIPGYERRVLK